MRQCVGIEVSAEAEFDLIEVMQRYNSPSENPVNDALTAQIHAYATAICQVGFALLARSRLLLFVIDIPVQFAMKMADPVFLFAP